MKKGKGSRTIKPIFKKDTTNEKGKLFNKQSELVRELQILERAKPQKLARAKNPVEKMQLVKELTKQISDKRKEISEITKKIEMEVFNNA